LISRTKRGRGKMPIESDVEQLCDIIMKKKPEFWESRNKAMIDLTTLVKRYEGSSNAKIIEIFTNNVFRHLKEPVKSLLSDLRSQQVRDVCLFLTQLSIVCKDQIKVLLREVFQNILDAVKVPSKVMSGFADDCIISMIRHSTFKVSIPVIINELKESKAKTLRERCLVKYKPLSCKYIIY
jgi:hypothetical protein